MDKKISELDLLTISADDDLSVMVDVDDSSGITKKVELVNQVPSFVLHAIQDLSKNIANLEESSNNIFILEDDTQTVTNSTKALNYDIEQSIGFNATSFEAIVFMDMVSGADWDYSSNASISRKSFFVKGKIGDEYVYVYNSVSQTSVPSSVSSLNPFTASNISNGKSESLTATLGSEIITMSVTSIGGKITFNFSTPGGINTGHRFGIARALAYK